MFEVANSVEGWAYSMDGTATTLAIVVMVTFCVLASAHIIYLTISGVSSNAWNSAAETIALAVNSSPTTYLQNTCAGIFGVNAFRIPVRIMVRGDENQGEHLELVFGGKGTVDAGMSKLVQNKEYGKLSAEEGYTTSAEVSPAH